MKQQMLHHKRKLEGEGFGVEHPLGRSNVVNVNPREKTVSL